MSRMPLNKASLSRQSALLASYRQFLPSLDLKRKQLMGECAKSKRRVRELKTQEEEQRLRIGQMLPMLANEDVALEGLVRVDRVVVEEENTVGVRLPVMREVVITVRDYSYFAMPHWVDVYVEWMQESLRLSIAERMERQRLALLEEAVQKMTQRVNLFEHVLIPQSEKAIRIIRIFLSDAERAAVVRAKLAKHKNRHEVGVA